MRIKKFILNISNECMSINNMNRKGVANIEMAR